MPAVSPVKFCKLFIGVACGVLMGCEDPPEVVEYRIKASKVNAEVNDFRSDYQQALGELRELEVAKREWAESPELGRLRNEVAEKRVQRDAARSALAQAEAELETMKSTRLP